MLGFRELEKILAICFTVQNNRISVLVMETKWKIQVSKDDNNIDKKVRKNVNAKFEKT